MEKKRIFLSATGLRSSNCIRRAYWHNVIRYRAKHSSIEAEFGKAIHLFISTYKSTGGNANAALKASRELFETAKYPFKPKKEWMNLQRLEAACISWQAHWITEDDNLQSVLGPDGKPIVELKFTVPFYVDEKVEVILDGVIDDIAQVGTNGLYAIRDYKSTQAWDADSYLKGKRLSAQLLLYYIVIEEYAKMYPQSIYADIYNKGFGCLIEGIFLKQYGEIKIQRSDLFMYNNETIKGFRDVLYNFVIRLAMSADHQQLPLPEGVLSDACRECDFTRVCGAVDVVAGEYVLQNSFGIKPSTTLVDV